MGAERVGRSGFVSRGVEVDGVLGGGSAAEAAAVDDVDAGEDGEAAGGLEGGDGFAEEGPGKDGGDDGLAQTGRGHDGRRQIAEGVAEGELAEDLGYEAQGEEIEIGKGGIAQQGLAEEQGGEEEPDGGAGSGNPEIGEGIKLLAAALGEEEVATVEDAGDETKEGAQPQGKVLNHVETEDEGRTGHGQEQA